MSMMRSDRRESIIGIDTDRNFNGVSSFRPERLVPKRNALVSASLDPEQTRALNAVLVGGRGSARAGGFPR